MINQFHPFVKLFSWLCNLSCGKNPGRIVVALATLSAVVLVATPVRADPIVWQLTHEFSGATPPEGILKVILKDNGSNTVELTVDATLLVGSEFVGALYLNVDPSLDPTGLTITDTGGPSSYASPSIGQGVDAFKADGDGFFDILMDFDNNNSDALSAGESALFTIQGAGLSQSSFLYLSANGGGEHGPFLVAAHVQGIGDDGDDSGWVTTNGEVPEASTMVLFGSGMLGLFGFAKRRFRSLTGR
ncbi:PEP-CTERM sorting domain-containing protein [bacterium]|nr:PEP-CTERM sorting domain-containing protein [bacterium]